MQILVLVGSLRKASYNRMVFETYRQIVDTQAQLLEGRYDDFPLYNDDLREQAIPESVSRLAEQVRLADGLLIISPEYNYSVPGPLKNAIDWLSKLRPQPFSGKPSSIVSASQGKLGGSRMQYNLRQVGVALNLFLMNGPEVMVAEVQKKFDENGHLQDADTHKHLAKHWEAFRIHVENGN